MCVNYNADYDDEDGADDDAEERGAGNISYAPRLVGQCLSRALLNHFLVATNLSNLITCSTTLDHIQLTLAPLSMDRCSNIKSNI